jgi:hypothetical protein
VNGYLLRVNGEYVAAGQMVIPVANGEVRVYPMTNLDGGYTRGKEVVLGAYPEASGYGIAWNGVDTGKDTIASVKMDRDRDVVVVLTPGLALPASTPAPTAIPLPTAILFLPTPTPTPTPTPGPTSVPVPTAVPVPVATEVPTATLTPEVTPTRVLPSTTPLPTLPVEPQIPRDITANITGDGGGISVRWWIFASSSEYEKYTINSNPAGVQLEVHGGANNVIVPGHYLTVGTSYTFTVFATNAHGEGPKGESNPVAYTGTPPTPTPAPTPTPTPVIIGAPVATTTPVPTATPVATFTPVPTATPVGPTRTPLPTATPVATATPAPTATPIPTLTVTLTVVGSNGDVCVELNKWSGCSSGDTQYTQGIHSITVTAGYSIGFELHTNTGYTWKFTEPNGSELTGSSGTHRGPLYYNVTENKSVKVEFLSE